MHLKLLPIEIATIRQGLPYLRRHITLPNRISMEVRGGQGALGTRWTR